MASGKTIVRRTIAISPAFGTAVGRRSVLLLRLRLLFRRGFGVLRRQIDLARAKQGPRRTAVMHRTMREKQGMKRIRNRTR